jgi:REP element-mobilizing transposase RayT
LANPLVHDLLRRVWLEADAWHVGRYVIMPDHLHLFCTPNGNQTVGLLKWQSYWRNLSTRRWPRPAEKPIWQRESWDRQMRSGESYEEKWAYVRMNPIRAGLVEDLDAWPYQGEMEVLPW